MQAADGKSGGEKSLLKSFVCEAQVYRRETMSLTGEDLFGGCGLLNRFNQGRSRIFALTTLVLTLVAVFLVAYEFATARHLFRQEEQNQYASLKVMV